MEGPVEKKLFDAAIQGNATIFRQLLQQDPLLLDKVAVACGNKAPLLHIAAAKGHVEIASILLSEAPRMCWSRDGNGMNPIHVAAMEGHIDVLEKMVEKEPFAAAEKVDGGSTVLHLCVKHGQLRALEILVEKLGRLLSVNNDDGDNVLHLAIKSRQLQIVRYLVKETRIDRRTRNLKAQTPLQILKETIHYSGSKKTADDIEIKKLLKSHFSTTTNSFRTSPQTKWLARTRDAIMVVAILIATMAFQVAVSPPGGVWQDNLVPPEGIQNITCLVSHKIGESVMGCYQGYRTFLKSNTVAFVMSLSTILLLISGLPFRRGIFMWGLIVIMWTAVTAVGFTYILAISMVTPELQVDSAAHVIAVGMIAWAIVMAILLVGNTLRMLILWLRRRPGLFRRFCTNNDNSSSPLHLQV